MVKDLIEAFFTKRLITSNHTKKSYSVNINKFFRLINKDMGTYFNPKKNLENFESDLEKVFLMLEKQNVPLLTRKTMFNAVKQFFCATDRRLKNLEFWDTLKNRIRGADPISEKFIPNTNDLRIILSHGNTCSRAMFLMQASTGCRIGELLALYPDDINTKTKPTPVTIRRTYNAKENNYVKNLTKTRKQRNCFMSDEATKAYLEWMKERDAYLKSSVEKSKYDKDEKDKRVFPMSDENAREIWERLVKRSGGDLFKKDTVTNRLTLHPHCLRAFFRSYLGNSDLAEHLMGHSTGMDKHYRGMKPEDLAREYQKYMLNVSVFEIQPDLTGVHDQLKQKDDEITKMKAEMTDMKMKLLELLVIKHEKQINGKKA